MQKYEVKIILICSAYNVANSELLKKCLMYVPFFVHNIELIVLYVKYLFIAKILRNRLCFSVEEKKKQLVDRTSLNFGKNKKLD